MRSMTVLQAVLLGAVQGLTEFLPVSSSGHLLVARRLMGFGEVPVLFDVLMHLPTLLAVCLVFRRRLGSIAAALWHGLRGRTTPPDHENLRLLLVVAGATVVTAVLGLALQRLVASEPLPSRVVGGLFLVTAVILVGARYLGGARGYGQLGAREALITGFGQGLGVLPGISRSGITISAALAAGLSRADAGEYAFILAIPAILGATVLEVRDIGTLAVSAPALAAGLAAAFVTGLAALSLLLRLIRGGRLYLFAFYLVPLGIVVLIVG